MLSFVIKANRVQQWAFLGWVTQIVSRFDWQKPCFLDDLLLRSAKTYPTAVIYPFQMAFSQFREQKPQATVRECVQQIRDALKNPVVEKFIKSLNYLSAPDKVLEHHLHNITIIQSKACFKREIKACFDNVFEGDMRGRSAATVKSLRHYFVELSRMDCEWNFGLMIAIMIVFILFTKSF